MSKNIVFCADGTWNGPSELSPKDGGSPSNVFKLFSCLAGSDSLETLRLADEQERVFEQNGNVKQITKYIHGVGDSDNFLVKILGGSLGAGIISRIVRGYTFISRSYEEGDKIYLLGFSRGAYTVRALAGLISSKGLLDRNRYNLEDKEQSYRLGSYAWYEWRRTKIGKNQPLLGTLQEAIFDLPAFVSTSREVPYTHPVSIDTIAVWDTVGALGIPKFSDKDSTIDCFRFADCKLSPSVKAGIHAVAVDEERAVFTPTLWEDDPRITQSLWPGSHSDVGGGYPLTDGESELSDACLDWMMELLKGHGVIMGMNRPFPFKPNPLGVAHQSWRMPSLIKLPLPHGPRTFPKGLDRSTALEARLAAPSVVPHPHEPAVKYAPKL